MEITQSGIELSESSRSVIMLATSPEFINNLLEWRLILLGTVMILSFLTDKSGQTMQAQISLLPKEFQIRASTGSFFIHVAHVTLKFNVFEGMLLGIQIFLNL